MSLISKPRWSGRVGILRTPSARPSGPRRDPWEWPIKLPAPTGMRIRRPTTMRVRLVPMDALIRRRPWRERLETCPGGPDRGLLSTSAEAGERTERFDKDPGWEGRNNHSEAFPARTVRQDFGYSPTRHAGGRPRGDRRRSSPPPPSPRTTPGRSRAKTFDDPLTASGMLACARAGVHVLVGFFNAGTVNEWRTPNTIALRLQGRGDVFYAYVEYATSRGGPAATAPAGSPGPRPDDRARTSPAGSRPGSPHTWSLTYDPDGNNGRGRRHRDARRRDGRLPPRRGPQGRRGDVRPVRPAAVMKSADSAGEVWLDDVTVDGETDDFDARPGLGGVGNRRTYETANVRPRFDFGYSPTHYAGGQAPGELGRPGLPRRLPLGGPDGRLRRPARPAHAGQAAEGVGQGGPAAGGERQHDAARVLPLRATAWRSTRRRARGSRRASSASRSRGRAARGSSSTRPTGRRRPAGLRRRPGPAAHPPRRQAARLVAGVRPRRRRRAGPDGGDARRASRSRSTCGPATGRPARRSTASGWSRPGSTATRQTIYFDDLTYTDSQAEGGGIDRADEPRR